MRSERSPIRCSTHWTPTTATTGGELLESLQSFLQHNARWETAAAQLFVHRHTLRYRMRKVEELTGRDLSSSFDRMSSGSPCGLAICKRRRSTDDDRARVVHGVQRRGGVRPFRRVVRSHTGDAY